MRALALIAATTIACSSSPAPPSNTEPAVVDTDYKALAWVPADATGALVARRVEDLVRLMREGGDLALMLAGYSMRDADGFMRARFDASPFVADDLAAAGINIGGSAAVFSRDAGVVAVLPVADGARIAEVLDRHLPVAGLERIARHGLDVVIWRSGDLAVSYALAGDWLLFRFGDRSGALDWLEQVVAVRGRGLGAEPVFARAKARAAAHAAATARRFGWERSGEPPDAVAVFRPESMLAGFGLAEKCATRAAGVAPTILAGAELESDRAAGFFELELTRPASSVLDRERPAPPPSGLVDQMSRAPMAGLWTVPPAVLETIRRRWGCDELDEPIDVSIARGATSVAAIGWNVDPGDPTETVGLLRITDLDTGVLGGLLGRIPGRSLLEKRRTIAGVELTVLGGRLGIPEIGYRLRADETAIGSPARRVARALSGEPAKAASLAYLRLVPGEIDNLGQLLGELTGLIDGDRRRGAELGRRLERYRWGEIALGHRRGVLRLTAAMELAGR